MKFTSYGEHAKRPSATKTGPGRYHQAGHRKNGFIKSKGAPRGFRLHTASAEKRQRKLLISLHGRRQYLKAVKAHRRAQKAAA